MEEVSFVTIFSLFLKALKFDAKINQAPNGYKVKKGNTYFRLIKSSRKILLSEKDAVFNGNEYEKVEKLYLYRIIEDVGNIKILDENNKTVVCLKNEHQILKIESVKPKEHTKVEFLGTADLLQYKEPTASIAEKTLF